MFIGGAPTNSSGVFTAEVPPGTIFAAVSANGFANQLYNGISCAGNIFNTNFSCNLLTGTPIAITVAGTTGNINFPLVANPGALNGLVTNAAGGAPLSNVPVQLFTSAGVLIGTLNTSSPSGLFTFVNIPPGSYYVRTNDATQGFINQLFNGVVCVGCSVTASGGTLVQVTGGGNTGGVNFPLATGGKITGTITNAAGGAAIQGIPVQIFKSDVHLCATTITNASGVYTSFALPAGTFFVKTVVNAAQNFVDQAYRRDCPASPARCQRERPWSWPARRRRRTSISRSRRGIDHWDRHGCRKRQRAGYGNGRPRVRRERRARQERHERTKRGPTRPPDFPLATTLFARIRTQPLRTTSAGLQRDRLQRDHDDRDAGIGDCERYAFRHRLPAPVRRRNLWYR